MAFNYAGSRSTADRLIASFGQAGAIRRTTSTGDAWSPTQTTADTPCTVVMISEKLSGRKESLTMERTITALIAAGGLAIVPTDADQIVVGGKAYQMTDVQPLSPGGTVVLYEVQARL